MGRPVQADGRRTRQAILDAALDLFAENGFFGTSLREIAARVGVRESALYNYFDSKEALFLALLDTAQDRNAEKLNEFLAEPATDVESFLERLTTRILDHFCEPWQQRLFLVSMSDGMRLAKLGRVDPLERMTGRAAPFQQLMASLIARGWLQPADPRVLSMEFMGPLLVWRQFHAINPNGPLVLDRNVFARDHVRHFLHGAGTPSAAGVGTGNRGTAQRRSRASVPRPRSASKALS